MTFPFTYNILNFDEIVPVTISGSWNGLCHFTLDLIATEIYHFHYGSKIVRNWKDKINIHPKVLLTDPTVIDKICECYKNPQEKLYLPRELVYELKIDLNKIYSQYRDVYSRRKRLIDTITKISNTLFQFKYSMHLNYIFKDSYLGANGIRKEKKPEQKLVPKIDNIINLPSHLLNLDSIDNNVAILHFSTPLSMLFTHNIISLNTDWIDDSIGKLSDNASFIYRKFMSFKKKGTIELSSICQMLGYDDPRNRHIYKEWVKKALKELVDFGFIKAASIGKFDRIKNTNYVEFQG
jgi:hypothetical protein